MEVMVDPGQRGEREFVRLCWDLAAGSVAGPKSVLMWFLEGRMTQEKDDV